MITKRGKFFHFEFMESGVRLYGTFNGKRYQYAASKQEARDLESALRSKIRGELRDGSYGKDASLELFAEFFDRVYMPYAKQNTAEWKHAEYRGEVLKAFFVGKKFAEIKPMMIVQYINTRLNTKSKRGKLFGPTTVNKEIVLLSGVFRMAMSEGCAESNPCDGIPKVIRKKIPARNKRERFLSREEDERLFAQFVGRRAHLRPMVRFYLETGLRKSELCRLEVQHVNLSTTTRFFQVGNKRVEVKPGWLMVEKSKSGKSGIVPLSPEARRIAEDQIADATTGKYLFTSRRTGGMVSELKTAFKAACKAAGIEDFTLHDCRHTFSTRLAESGVDPYSIRDLLRHATTEMSADYTHTSQQQREKAVAQMAQAKGEQRSNVVILDSVKITA